MVRSCPTVYAALGLLEKLMRIMATKEQNGCDFALRSTGSSLPLLFLLKDALTAALFETQWKGLPAVRKKPGDVQPEMYRIAPTPAGGTGVRGCTERS